MWSYITPGFLGNTAEDPFTLRPMDYDIMILQSLQTSTEYNFIRPKTLLGMFVVKTEPCIFSLVSIHEFIKVYELRTWRTSLSGKFESGAIEDCPYIDWSR